MLFAERPKSKKPVADANRTMGRRIPINVSCADLLRDFNLPSSQRQIKNNIYLCVLGVSAVNTFKSGANFEGNLPPMRVNKQLRGYYEG